MTSGIRPWSTEPLRGLTPSFTRCATVGSALGARSGAYERHQRGRPLWDNWQYARRPAPARDKWSSPGRPPSTAQPQSCPGGRRSARIRSRHTPSASWREEGYVKALGEVGGVETIVLRYFNVFGPGQDPTSQYAAVVPRFIVAALTNERPVVYGKGLRTGFTYVTNVVQANLLACEVPGVVGAILNVGYGERSTLLDLLATIGSALGVDLDPVFEPASIGDVRDSQADISRATEILGYRPDVDLAAGIARTVESFVTAGWAPAA